MSKKLHFKSWLLMLCMLLGVGNAWATDPDEKVDFSAQGYDNQQAITFYSGTDFTVSFNKGTNNNAPKYYTSGTAIRAYGGNYFTVSSTTKTIEKIVITFGSGGGSNAITTDEVSYEDGTWEGSASSVTFTIGGTSGNRRIKALAIYYASSGGENPSITASNVNIDYNVTSGSIAYSLANATGNVSASVTSGDWLTLGTITASEVPFTCSANTESTARTATVTLSYTGASDKVVTITQTAAPLANLAALVAAGAGSNYVTLTNALVTYKNGNNAYIQDASAGMYLYGCAGDLAAGDQISGVMNVTTTVYKNLPEVTAFTLVDGYTKTSGNTVTPEEVTLAALEADYENYISRYVVVKGGSITAFSSKNATLTQGSNEITVHDQVGSLTATDGAAVNVYGHPSIYNSTHQLAVWEQTQIEETTVDPIDPTITVADADVEYGSTFTISESDITGGSVTVTSSNEAVATVSGLEITPVAVGTTTITVSTAATSVYNAGSKTFELTVTAPVGQDKAGANAVFYEGFSGCTTSGGNDGTWNAGLGDLNDVTLATGLTLSEKAYAASACVRLGTSSAQGSATITVAVKTGNTYTLSFNAAPWSSEGATVMTVNVTGGTISGISDAAMTPQQWTAYVGTVTATADELTIEIVSTGSKRFFLDEISLSSEALFNVTLNSKGYASYANVSPLDFTDAESDGYSAWEITNISGSTITFNQITEAIKGGQGVLLKGTASATVQIPSVDSETELTSNLLTGTTAPSYVDADKYYGLSGETFKKMNAGTVKANKAVIDASLISSSVKTLTFVFNSVDGIQTVETVSAEEAAQIFDLSGRRLAQPRKGVNIIGGKKVLVK